MIDIISTYFPSVAEIDDATLMSARTRAQTYLLQLRPDLDTRPGSVFGDSVLDPFAEFLAATEIAVGRIQSDLVLENIAKGVIWSCDFVEDYLKNFAIVDQVKLPATGVVRYLFNADQSFTIARDTLLSFGETTPYVFRPRLPYSGDMEVYPVGSTLPANANVRALVEVAPAVYAIDIPVEGAMTIDVVAGVTASSDHTIDEVISITALADFSTGSPPDSLATLASKARTSFFSSTFNTAPGAERYLEREFPDLAGRSIITSGAAEMTKDDYNILGFPQGEVVAYIRSNSAFLIDSQIIKVPYLATQNAAPLDKYVVEWTPPSIPLLIDSLVCSDNEDLTFDEDSFKVFSQSTAGVLAPMSLAGGTVHERLWLVIDSPIDIATGDALLIPSIDSAGNPYNTFTITYRTDPMIRVVSEAISKPVGVNVLVKGMNVIDIQSLTISYTRDKGVTPSLENARLELFNYFQSLGYPSVFTEAKVADAMFYAGVKDVTGIACVADVKWSAAKYFLKQETAAPDSDYVESIADAIVARHITIAAGAGLLPVYRDGNLGEADETFEACSHRTVCYKLNLDDIHFREVVR